MKCTQKRLCKEGSVLTVKYRPCEEMVEVACQKNGQGFV